MQIKIHLKNVKLTPKQETLVKGKIEPLTRLADRIKDESSKIRVDISHEQSKVTGEAYECHLTLFIPHATLRSESREETLENALDEAVKKMRPQIDKYKAKEQHLNDRRNS